MTDQELRQLVRDIVSQRVGQKTLTPLDPEVTFRLHASHGLLPLLRGADGEGACLIEPAVRCNHCGYCLSYGH